MYTVAALYKFAPFDDPAALRGPLVSLCQHHGITGSLLLAHEGINGTVAGSDDAIAKLINHLRQLPGCADLEWKRSTAKEQPFGRLKVRLKREIVTLGRPEADPNVAVGTYVTPQDWNALIEAPDVVVIDTRNTYETQIGTFRGAVDPGLESFGEFPEWWAKNRETFAGKRVAMFCTGGIRCEKSTALLKHEGIDEVFHLQGGILKYLEDIDEAQSLWDGECFVFDQRVSLTHGLGQGSYDLCHGCRRPISDADKISPDFELGVSCPACNAQLSDSDRARFRERQRQISLARSRGARHLGQTDEKAIKRE